MSNVILAHLQNKLLKHQQNAPPKPMFFNFWIWVYWNGYLAWTLHSVFIATERKVAKYEDYLSKQADLKCMIDFIEENNIDQNTINDYISKAIGRINASSDVADVADVAGVAGVGDAPRNKAKTWMETYAEVQKVNICKSLMRQLNIEQTWETS